jgi:hypothetical protein
VAVAVLIGSTIDAVAVAVAVAMAGSEHIGYQSLRIYVGVSKIENPFSANQTEL